MFFIMKKVLFLIVLIVILGLVFAGCGLFNVTLPDGGSNLSRAIGNPPGDVYGIERDTGIVWGIDVATGSVYQIFTVVSADTSSVGPNGLAYDGENGRFYYCDYPGTSTLYFWDGTQELVACSLPYGDIAAADFDDGKYYFITGPPASDDLYEVTFNSDGTMATMTKLADIAGGEHGWTFNGDIAVKDGVVYGWGLCSHGYEFFTYDLSTPSIPATVIKTDYPNSLQLAFGLDDNLYGHRSGSSGDFFVIDTATGNVSYVSNTGGVLFTDLASAYLAIEEVPGIEVMKECPPAFAYVGDTLTYNYTVTNTGDGALLDVSLVDDQLGSITLTGLTDIDGIGGANDLAWDASATGTDDYVVLEGDTVLLNTATASSTSEIDDSLVEATSDECMVEICYEETAFGGETVGLGKAWWFYFDTSLAETQTIWAGQHYDAGTVTVSECIDDEVTITIELADGWYLQDDDESVKIQGYDESVPSKRQPAGKFKTYKGDETEVGVPCFEFYIIHLDVQHCGEFEFEDE